ncbi:MAG: 50S ribosomal protein L11 methyltransferase [Gemmatimonadota bacterium]
MLAFCGTLGAWNERPDRTRAYFDGPVPGLEVTFAAVWRAFTGAECPCGLSRRPVEPADWVAAWRVAVRPVAVTPSLWIAPPAAPPDAVLGVDDRVIWIEPGEGFGTGTHPTTQALLRWLAAGPAAGIPLGGAVLDLGTGSGVLALTALACGARRATGLDLDAAALGNAAQNRALNRRERDCALVRGSIDAIAPGARFDVVLANLDGRTLPPLLSRLAAHCAVEGRVGVAGLLLSERGGVLAGARTAGLRLLEETASADPFPLPDPPDGAAAPEDVWWSGWFAPASSGV